MNVPYNVCFHMLAHSLFIVYHYFFTCAIRIYNISSLDSLEKYWCNSVEQKFCACSLKYFPAYLTCLREDVMRADLRTSFNHLRKFTHV